MLFFKQLPELKREALIGHAVIAGKCLLFLILPASLAYLMRELAHARIEKIKSDLKMYTFHGDATISPALDIAAWGKYATAFHSDGSYPNEAVSLVASIHPLPDELGLFLNLRKNRYHWTCKISSYDEYTESHALSKLREFADISSLISANKDEVYTSAYDACKEQIAKGNPQDEAKILTQLAKSQINKFKEIEAKENFGNAENSNVDEPIDDPFSHYIQPRFYRKYIETYYFVPAKCYVASHQLGRANRLIKRAIKLCSHIDWPPSPENMHLEFLNHLYLLSILTETPVKLIGQEENVIRYLNALDRGAINSSEISIIAMWHPQLALYMDGLLKFKQMEFVSAMNSFSECRNRTGDRDITYLDDMCCLMMARCAYWYSYFSQKAPESYKRAWENLQATPQPRPKWIMDPESFISELATIPKNHFATECNLYCKYLEEEKQ